MKRKYFNLQKEADQLFTGDAPSFTAIFGMPTEEPQTKPQTCLKKYFSQFGAFLERHPKRTMMWMFVMVSLNFCLFLFINRSNKSAYHITGVYSGALIQDNFSAPDNGGVPFNIANFFFMKKIMDSLEYYREKQPKTAADTLLLLRLFKKYEQLDTSFKILHHEKN